jgi:hypothetical protein
MICIIVDGWIVTIGCQVMIVNYIKSNYTQNQAIIFNLKLFIYLYIKNYVEFKEIN